MVDEYKDWKIISFHIGGLGINVGTTGKESFEELQNIMDHYIEQAKEFSKTLPMSIIGIKESEGGDSYG